MTYVWGNRYVLPGATAALFAALAVRTRVRLQTAQPWHPRAKACRPVQARRGAALLEVVVALALFFGVAVAILGGLNTCVQSARDVRLQAQASDLAVTLLSEVQLGLVPVADAGPVTYEAPLEDWTWEITAVPVDAVVTGLEVSHIQIIIRNTPQAYVYRLHHLAPQLSEEAAAALAESMGEMEEAP